MSNEIKFNETTINRITSTVEKMFADESIDAAIMARMSNKVIADTLLHEMGVEIDDSNIRQPRFRFRYLDRGATSPIRDAIKGHVVDLATQIAGVMNNGTIVLSAVEVEALRKAYKEDVRAALKDLLERYSQEEAGRIFNEMIKEQIQIVIEEKKPPTLKVKKKKEEEVNLVIG